MIKNPQVPLHRLILSLSEALDYVHPRVADHQQRVAYIATNMARHMGITGQELFEVFQAAALHDIGLIGMENRVKALHLGQLEHVDWHSEAGFELLKTNTLFRTAAEIVRFHHTRWANGRGAEHQGEPIPLPSHILVLADKVERMLDRDAHILERAESITKKIVSLSGDKLHPDCVEAFRHIAQPEAFWLDCTSGRIYSILLKQVDWPSLVIDEVALVPIAEIFSRIVDAASRWTAVHSAGVTATAVALAERLGFSPRELHLMRAAGYLHDLGKLSVPTSLLDKPDKLTFEEMAVVKGHTYHTFRILDTIGGMPQISEWAAFHHERLDGNGYPFRHSADDMTLGSRIMAVADVFTAITEDRPYREGMSPKQSLNVLKKMAASNGIDGDIVAVVDRDYAAIDGIRQEEQAEYREKQTQLMASMRQPVEESTPEPCAVSN